MQSTVAQGISLFFGFLFILPAHADCWQAFKAQTDLQMQQREQQYQKYDSSFQTIHPLSRAYTQDGSRDELVILMHGFLGSANEMRTLADMANKAGFKVYSALIPGFGGTAVIANQVKKEEWISWTNSEMARAEQCFTKIHMIGFSTGGTLFHNYVSTHPTDTHLASMTLISPFFRTYFLFNLALKAVKFSFMKKISIAGLTTVFPVEDAKAITENPETYLQTVPLQSMQQVVDLGQNDKKQNITQGSLKIPVLAILSADDLVADHTVSEKLLQFDYVDLDLTVFKGPPHVPHQLMLYSVSPKAEEAYQLVYDFLMKN